MTCPHQWRDDAEICALCGRTRFQVIKEGDMPTHEKNQTIYKFDVDIITGEMSPDPPSVHRILSAKEQDGQLRVWAVVDRTSPPKAKRLLVLGTGHQTDHDITHFRFIDTVVMSDGLVWHVFTR